MNSFLMSTKSGDEPDKWYHYRLSFPTIILITAGGSAFFLFIISMNILGVVLAKKRIRELELSSVAEGYSHVDHQERE